MLSSLRPRLARRAYVRFASTQPQAVILAATRTPIGAFQSQLASLSAIQLGSVAIKGVMAKVSDHIKPSDVHEVIMGNVVSANLGQAPATQAAINAGIPNNVPTTVVNKVCSSGLKTIMFAAQSIKDGSNQLVLCGGFESMSNIPHYLTKARSGYGFGHGQLVDGLVMDGLSDAFDGQPMGIAGEDTASKFGITREAQDEFCLRSYARAMEAQQNGSVDAEITPVTVKSKKGETVISRDEEPAKLLKDKVPNLKPAFKKDGTITPANASKLNDGAAALLVSSVEFAQSKGVKPLARILAYADAQRAPIEFPIAPADAIPLALKRAGLTVDDVDFFEINEAFSAVALANMKILNLPAEKVNVSGGAVALGHPLGASGARIVVTLLNVLKQRNGKIGVAAICNGGGGASAVVLERIV